VNVTNLSLNSKHEIRNSMLLCEVALLRSTRTNSNNQNLNDQNKNGNSKLVGAFVLNFEHLNIDIVSGFDIRISDLLVLS